MMRLTIAGTVAAMLACGGVFADTVVLKSGVQLEGTLGEPVGNIVTLQVGNRTTLLRQDEILSVEKNDKTGAFDKEALRAAALQREDEVTRATGLTTAERQAIKDTFALLISTDERDYAKGVSRLVELGRANGRVFDFLAEWVPSMLPRFVPGVLDALHQLDPGKARPILVAQCMNVDWECRAKTLRLLAKVGADADLILLARGLIDPTPDVQTAAAAAIAEAKGTRATPVLIANLASGDARVRNSSCEALAALWSPPGERLTYTTQSEWQEFWVQAAAGVAQPYDPAALTALVEPGSVFQDE